MYEPLLIFLFILLFLLVLLCIVFGYIWLKYQITPFYEAPYNITETVAKVTASVAAVLLLLLTIIFLFVILTYYFSEESETDKVVKKGVVGNVVYEAPMWKTN